MGNEAHEKGERHEKKAHLISRTRVPTVGLLRPPRLGPKKGKKIYTRKLKHRRRHT